MLYLVGNAEERFSHNIAHQVRLNTVCATTENSQGLEIADIETRGIIQFQKQTTKALIRLCKCMCRLKSVSLLFTLV